jgi:hypothetical protein
MPKQVRKEFQQNTNSQTLLPDQNKPSETSSYYDKIFTVFVRRGRPESPNTPRKFRNSQNTTISKDSSLPQRFF